MLPLPDSSSNYSKSNTQNFFYIHIEELFGNYVQELLGGNLGSDVVDNSGAVKDKKEEPLERIREAALINLQPGERRKVNI